MDVPIFLFKVEKINSVFTIPNLIVSTETEKLIVMSTRFCYDGQLSGLYTGVPECIFVISLSAWSLIHLHCKKSKIHPHVKCWATSSIICIILSSATKIFVDVYCEIDKSDTIISNLARNFAVFLAAAALWFLVVLFITRLRLTFDVTIHQISNKIYRLMVSGCIFIVLLVINMFIALILGFERGIVVPGTLLIASLVFVPLCAIIVYLFASRMNRITVTMRHRSKSKDVDIINEQEPPTTVGRQSKYKGRQSIQVLSDMQLDLLKITSKYTLLACIAMISSTISSIAVTLVLIVFVLPVTAKTRHTTSYLAHQWLFVDNTVNIVCMVLQFPFALNMYYKFCQCCDRQCQECFAQQIDKRIQKITSSTSVFSPQPQRELQLATSTTL